MLYDIDYSLNKLLLVMQLLFYFLYIAITSGIDYSLTKLLVVMQ